MHSDIDETAERTGEHRQRQRDHDSPERAVRPHDRQLPGDGAAVADQGPAHDHGNGGAEIGAHREQRRGDRIDGERPTWQDRAEGGTDQKTLQAGGRSERARDLLVRQDFGDERAEQAAGEDPRQDAAEQAEIMGQDLQHAVDAVAAPDQRGADCHQHADRDHRPADRLAAAAPARPAIGLLVRGRRGFQGNVRQSFWVWRMVGNRP